MRRTRLLLQGALRTLLHAKSFDQISVQDITDEATVNRATFYDHYTDKFALLEAMLAGGFHRLLEQRKVSYDGSCPGAARAIILAACEFITECEEERPRQPEQGAFEPLVDAAIVRAIRRVLLGGVRSSPDRVAASSELIAAAASGAIYGAIREWSLTPNRPPAEEIVPLVLQLVLPILQAPAPPECEAPGGAPPEHEQAVSR
jgi:AcrR family transcriptional regulator